jgi:hypothetical protein
MAAYSKPEIPPEQWPDYYETQILNRVLVDRLLASLNANDRALVELIFFEAQSVKETARHFGKSEPWVRYRMRLVLTDLRRLATGKDDPTVSLWNARYTNRKVAPQPCGTNAAYGRGCRCEECIQGRKDYDRRRRMLAAQAQHAE